ncbi:MAG: DUF2156 domain-containing protein [Deltaproteobacteria bacterium]|nr:MAG: DUF2156 domain-containing protein [Deltaproteobacteria bacterium]
MRSLPFTPLRDSVITAQAYSRPARPVGLNTYDRGEVALSRSLGPHWVTQQELSETKQHVLAVLKKYGRHATSFQVLESGYEYWCDTLGGCDVVVAYMMQGRYRVVAGPPIAPSEHFVETLEAFVKDCNLAGQRPLFVSVEDDVVHALKTVGASTDALVIGEQPEWDPQTYEPKGRAFRTLRSQVRRAERKGVTIRALSTQDILDDHGPLGSEIAWVVEQWKASRKISPMQFMVDLQPFHLPSQRRYFVAECQRRAVGVLIAVPVYQRQGWFFEDILRIPGAPNGTVELMVDTAMRTFQDEGSGYVTLGLSPLSHIDQPPESHPWLHRMFGLAYNRLGKLYPFAGLHAFKRRFVPDRWSKQYIVSVGYSLHLGNLQVVLRALLGEGLWGFLWDSSKRLVSKISYRRWSQGLLGFAGLLIPWTLLLALADGQKWFGSLSTQYAWVTFDVALALALVGMSRLVLNEKPRSHSLSVFLAGGTFANFVLTTVQTYHLHQDVTGWSTLFVAAGVLGPLLATVFLLVFGMNKPSA